MLLSRKDKWLMFLVYFSALSAAWVLTKEPAEIYAGYLVFFLFLPGFIVRYGIPSYFWVFSLFFLVTGFFNIFMDSNTIDQFLKIFIGLIVSYLFYFYILKRFEYDAGLLFHYYLKAALIVSAIGLVQFVSYIVKFTPGYDFRWLPIFNKWSMVAGGNLGIRVNSVFSEPSQYAAVMAPAAFVAVYNLLTFKTFVFKRWQSAMVLVVYVLTFSSLGYVGLLFIIIMMLVNYGFARYLLLFIPILMGVFVYIYNTVPDFRYRWDSTLYLFETGEVDISSEHGSSIVFYNNFVVATENFKSNFLFGTGLGSHSAAFEKYSVTKNIETFGFANNQSDANSMLLRIISEIGLVGVIIVVVFISRNFVKRNRSNPDEPYWIISSAMLCVIVLYLFRQGHYFINGFPLFAWIYYYNHKNYMASLEAPVEETEETEEADENGTGNLVEPEPSHG